MVGPVVEKEVYGGEKHSLMQTGKTVRGSYLHIL